MITFLTSLLTISGITIFNLAYYANIKKAQVKELKAELAREQETARRLKAELNKKPATKYDRALEAVEVENLWAKF